MTLLGKLLRAVLLLLILAPRAPADTFFILPFENQTKNASLEWISESFVEGIAGRLLSPRSYVASRDERAAAFDMLGIPQANILSRATIIKLAQTMDADFVVTGEYSVPGPSQLKVTAQVLDMRAMKLSQRFVQIGPMVELLEIQDRLGRAIAQTYESSAISAAPGMPSLPLPPVPPAARIRLDAWEHYIRGLDASSQPQQVKHLLEAVRLEPTFARAALQLGKVYFQNRDYATAAPWLARLRKGDTGYLESRFLLGICHFFLGQYERSETAFAEVSSELPLNEVSNNLGAAQSRRGRRTALDNFRRAADGDPTDADYHFNVGYWYWKAGQHAQAARSLRAALERKPGDTEARALLARSLERAGSAAEAAREREALLRTPAGAQFASADDSAFEGLERLKRKYDEPSFRQLQMTLQTLAEESLAALPPERHALAHLDRGRDLFREQNDAEALKELTEAARLGPARAETHLLLARLHERNARPEDAIREAEEALRLENSVDGHLLLAKIYLEQNKLDQAKLHAAQALRVEPGNVAARSVLTTIEMRSP